LCAAQCRGVCAPVFGALVLATGLGKRHEGRQGGIKEPTEPDAFTTPCLTDPIHAIVPVARTDQRQAMRTGLEAAIEGAGAMLEQ
jgi:hypothetical protein